MTMHLSASGPADGRTLLLLHGGGVAGWMWNPMKRHLSDDLRLLIPDLPGHGRSTGEPYLSHDDTVAGLIDVLEQEARPVGVVGFSLGAQLAVLLAARRPDLVERVAVVSAQARPLRAPGLLLTLLGATAGLARREWFARLQARELFVPEELIDDYLTTSASMSRETLLAAVGENIRFTVPSEWSDYPGSALLLVGAREKALMRESAASLQDALPGSTREVVEGCGHGIPLQQPAWFAARLERWLDA